MTVQKRTNSLDWNDLRYLLELSRQGSLSGAARALGVNHATVGRRLDALEQQLGAALTERAGRQWRLTALGQEALAAASRIEEPALQIERLAAGRNASYGGHLRLTGTEGAAMLLLVPALLELRRRHPGLTVTLLTDHKPLSLARREADLALRWARPRGGELYARKLGEVPFRLYVRDGFQASAQPLPTLGYDESLDELPEQRWLLKQPERFRFVFRCNSMPVLLSALRAGLGAGLLPEFAARQWPDLIPLEKAPALSRELWLVRHKDTRQAPRLRAAADAIAESIVRQLKQSEV
ncbi:LysR family transcriptional regulator [Ferrovibrio sp. MS7]|uniref:LysR family transcriptional regulator n=1 Tax=Ferrovibrio plantarum TaxID=3119164 RepID=UPI0031356CDA